LKAVLGRKKDEGNLTSKENSFHNQTEKEETSFVLYTEAFIYEEFDYFCKRNILYRNAEWNIFELRNVNARIAGAATYRNGGFCNSYITKRIYYLLVTFPFIKKEYFSESDNKH
jgi:hypothetical protein